MKQKLFLMVFGALLALTAVARDFMYTYEGQTITYTVIDEDAKTCKTKQGHYDDIAGNNVSGELKLPENPKDGDQEFTLKEIGYYSFTSSNLTSITIPSTVSYLGDGCFSNCTSLSSIDLPDSIIKIYESAFSGCTSLSSIDLPDSVTAIWANAFSGCTSLTSFTIPRSIYSIGNYVFSRCDNLKILNYEAEQLRDDYSYTLQALRYSSIETVNIGQGVKCLPYLFTYCNSLRTLNFNAEECSIEDFCYTSYFPSGLDNVKIGESVKNIPANIFYGCKNLKSIKLPKSITEIGKDAFSGCEKLETVEVGSIEDWLKIDFESMAANPLVNGGKLLVNGENISRRLTIPDGIERLNSYAFSNCKSLLTVTLPASLKSLGNNVFDGCEGIQRFIFPTLESFLAINYDADEYDEPNLFTVGNEGKIFIDNKEFDKDSLKEWTIPSTWTRIPNFAFYGYRNLEKITIPETVTEIGVGTFISCYGLRDVKLPHSLAKIGKYAFRSSGIKSIEFGNSIESIGVGAFDYCYMESVHIADLEKWSQVRFEHYKSSPRSSSGSPFGNFSSNPITRSRSFSVGDSYEPLKHLCLNLENGSVSAGCFAGADNLETVKIEAQSIDEGAFSGCSNLKEVYVDVDTIDEYAFDGTPALTSVYCPRQEPPVAFDKSFGTYDGAHLYVPEGCVGRYENAENCWWNFLEISESDFADIDDIFDPDNITGIQDMFSSEMDMSRPYSIYDMNGSRVADTMESLSKGFYLIRQGNMTRKVIVK